MQDFSNQQVASLQIPQILACCKENFWNMARRRPKFLRIDVKSATPGSKLQEAQTQAVGTG